MSTKKYLSNGGDEQFDAFMRESLSSDESSIDTSRMNRYLDNSRKKKQTLWKIEDEDEETENYGLSGTGKMFLKKKAPIPAARKEVDFGRKSRDSLDDESLQSLNKVGAVNGSKSGVPTLNLGIGSSASYSETPTANEYNVRNVTSLAAGKETMDEMAEKEKFFKELERNRSTTVDYGRLNQELDRDGTMAFGGTLENTTGSDSILMNHYDDAPSPAKANSNSKEGEGMLSKVSLLDSLDSTVGSNKPGASKDREREMNTIHEVDSHNQGEGYDEPDATVFHDHIEDARRTDTEHTQGITLKTGTGLGYTNTSREIEALQDALKQVGLGTIEGEDYTLKDSSTMQGKSSMFATQKTQEGTGGSSGTPQFGLKPVVPPRSDRRTVDDILREAKESKPFSRENRPSVHFKEDMESRGFDLSPVHSVNKTSDHTGALDLSPISKYKSHDSTFNNSDLEKNISVAQLTDVSDHQESTPIVTKKTQKKTPKDPFSHIRSSGYGHSSSQPVWSPSDKQKRKLPISGAGEVKPPLKSASSTKSSTAKSSKSRASKPSPAKKSSSAFKEVDLGQNPAFLQSVESFAQYVQSLTSGQLPSQLKDTLQPTNGPRTEHTQDMPVLSSSQKLAILEREHHMLHEVQNWQEILREEKKIQAKLRVELETKEKEYERKLEKMKIDHDQEIFALKQENYVLSAKITEEAASKKRSIANGDVAVHSEQVKLMEQEIKEQEKLLAGYQQENERIYQEMKKMQTVSKATEEKMFKENQRLQNEVVSLRDQLNRKEIELRNKGVITGIEVQQQIAAGNQPKVQEVDTDQNVGSAVLGANRIAVLEGALKEAKRREEVLLNQIETEKKGKQELDARMELVVSQMHNLENKLQNAKQFQTKQDKEKHDEYEAQITKLEKKLKWYAENQDLLDKDLQIIKKKDDEIKRLKIKLDNLQSETGRKTAEMRLKTKERSADAKRIQDLERQVKEMEGIMRKRHPNSLPVLMWAASTAPDPQDGDSNKSGSVRFLENRIRKLEKELEEKDEGEKTEVRALEQKYNLVKFQYEERISDLDSRLSKYERPGDQKLKEGDRPHSHASALQKELDRARERHKKEGVELKAEIDRLKKEVQTLKNKEIAVTKAEQKSVREKGSELELRVKAMQIDHTNQEKDKQMLLLQIEQLKKEKQQLAIEASRNAARMAKSNNEKLDSRRNRGRPKSAGSVRSQRSLSAEPIPLTAFSETVTREKYDPGAFTGHHVSDLHRENEQLRAKFERLELEHEQQRVMTSKVYAETEAKERRLREEYAEKLQAIKHSHQIEVQRLLTEHAMKNSTSKLAEVTGKLNTQEVMVRHLKDQLTQSQVDGEQLAVLKIRETTLENQLKQIQEELKEARKSHTPEMRHYEALQNKIVMLETRHAQREQELKHVIHQTRLNAHADLNEEIDKWKQVVEAKNRETERFRTELDQILGVLKELQRQGVILPYNHMTAQHR